MDWRSAFLLDLTKQQRIKTTLLAGWFFLTVATLWLLKPVRVGSLLAHLGANELPYVRLGAVATVAVVVGVYSIAVNHLSREAIVRWSNGLFGAALLAFWLALHVWGATLGGERAFVWAVYILVEIYSVVMIGIFWTYANDVVTSGEANRMYGIIGLGGVLGGLFGGAFVDVVVPRIGPTNLLAVCALLCAVAIGLAAVSERVLKPAPREKKQARADEDGPTGALAAALAGAREVRRSRYLMLLVAIVVTYEFAATLTDFSVSVIFERAFRDEVTLAQMYGRLGWIASGTAVVGQLVLVPLLLPRKAKALVVGPLVMLAGVAGLALLPGVAMAIFLSAADRGVNYSLQQATKESLYVPLTDAQKYKGKAFIDMLVDRAAKATGGFVLIGVIESGRAPVHTSLAIAAVAIALWLAAARRLGRYWKDERVPPASTSSAASCSGGAHRASTP